MGTERSLDQQFLRFRRTKSPADLAPIFHGLSPRLMRSAQRAGLDEQGAEDVVQETFLAFLEAQDRFDADRPLVPWIQGIALRQIRAEKRRRARTAAALQASGETPGVDAGADRPLAARELRRSVQGALSSLSEANRVVVAAAVLEGMGIDEMASRFGLSRSAVSVRLHRGLARVRERLGERSSLGILALAVPRSGDTVPQAMGAKGAVSGGGAAALAAWVGAAAVLVSALAWWGLRGPDQEEVEVGPRIAHAAEADGGHPAPAALEEPRRSEAEVAPAPAPETFIEGRVELASGLPAPAGGQVFAMATDPQLVLPEAPLAPLAETDDEGRFRVPVSKLPDGDRTPLLMVRAGEDVGWVDADVESGGDVVIVLGPSFHLKVRVTDEDGAPVEGAELAAFTQVSRFVAPMGPISNEFGFIPLEPYRHLFGATTDGQGIGVVGGLFGANRPDMLCGLSVRAPGYASSLGAYLSDGGTELKIGVTLRRPEALALEGQALDVHGGPIEGVTVRAMVRGSALGGGEIIAESGVDGRWAVPTRWLDEFPLILELDHPRHAPERINLYDAADVDGEPWIVSMNAQVELRGRVIDACGEPAAGARVDVVGACTSTFAIADDSGRFIADSVVAASGHHLLATHQVAGGPLRCALESVRVGADEITLVLEDGAAADTVDVVLEGADSWSRCALVPADGGHGFVDLDPESIEGRTARFRHVLEGRWFVCGQASGGDVVVEEIDVDADGGTLPVAAVQSATLDCVTAGGSGGQCLLVARRVDLPELPSWIYDTGSLPRTNLYGAVPSGETLGLRGLVPGRWQVHASGDGWVSEPVEVTLSAGEKARVDLVADPAGVATASFRLASVTRACVLRIEVRRSELDPWHMVAMPSVAMGIARSFDVRLAPGSWEWRAWLDTNGAELGALGLGPATHGVVELEAGGRAEVDVLAGEIR